LRKLVVVWFLFAVSSGCSSKPANEGGHSTNPKPDSSVPDSIPTATSQPGDRFFDSVGTTTGTPTQRDAAAGGDAAATDSTSFRMAILTFDPKYAADHPAGTPGSNPSIQEAAGHLSTPDGQTISLDGTWADDGTVSLQGGGWTFQGTIVGIIITGSIQGTSGTGIVAGANITAGQVIVSFGSRDDGTSFSLVVSQAGPVAGVIGGASGGIITGSASGNSLSFSWRANGANGTGAGTVDTSGNLYGTSNASGCQWFCGPDGPQQCTCLVLPDAGGMQSNPAACNYSCCVAYTAIFRGAPTSGCDCIDPARVDGGCPAVIADYNGGDGTSAASKTNQCPPQSTAVNCPPSSWQAVPAPCISYTGQPPGTNLHTGVAVACYVVANEPGYTGDQTPTVGACACPAAGGCNKCGMINSCCEP